MVFITQGYNKRRGEGESYQTKLELKDDNPKY